MKRILVCVLMLAMLGMSQAITYVDADFSNGNTEYAPSSGLSGPITLATTDTVDGLWRYRGGFGLSETDITLPIVPIATGGTGTVYESAGNSGADDVPRVVTSVGGLAMNTYDVYVYYWSDQAGSPWRIRAGLADTVDPLTLFSIYDGSSTQVGTDSAGRKLWQASLGQVTGTSISVFVEDAPAANGNERTWYDGIGYEAIPEPATLALLGLGALAVIRKRK